MDVILAPIFDAAIAGFEARNTKAYDEEAETCVYRDQDGNPGCFFGQMMTDEAYANAGQIDPDLEKGDPGITIEEPLVLDAIEKSTGVMLTDYIDSHDLSELQSLHDYNWKVGKPFRPLIPADIQMRVWGEVV